MAHYRIVSVKGCSYRHIVQRRLLKLFKLELWTTVFGSSLIMDLSDCEGFVRLQMQRADLKKIAPKENIVVKQYEI